MKTKNIMSLSVLFTLFIIMLSSCSFGDFSNKQLEDGSEVIHPDQNSYFHRLFDDYGVHVIESSDSIVCFPEKNRQEFVDGYNDNFTSLTPVGLYLKYAYSDKGYIAYFDFDKSTDTGKYFLYDVYGDNLKDFSSITEMYEYLTRENIQLGKWRYREKGEWEEELIRADNWSVVTVGNFAVIRNGYEDMFSGKIDKFIAENDYLAFHIDINGSMESFLRAFGNPILKCEEENIIDYTFLFDIPIYYDHYIVVDCKGNSYEIFEDKKEAENYLSSKNIDAKWECIN